MAKVQFILCCLYAFLRDAPAKLTDSQKAVLLQAHNFYRGSVSPPAADMQAMRWSDALSELAQQTAEKCDFKTNFNASQPMGENTLSAPANIQSYDDLVKTQWFAEYQSYDYNSGGCSSACSHYTQLVRSSYDQLGCGSAVCNPVRRLSGALLYNALFLVCKYGFAAANTNRQPYLSGSYCSACPSNKPICSNKLCDASFAAITLNSTQLVQPKPTVTAVAPAQSSSRVASLFINPSPRVTASKAATTTLSPFPSSSPSKAATTTLYRSPSPSAAASCSARSCSTSKATPTSTVLANPRPQGDVPILATPVSKYASSPAAKPSSTSVGAIRPATSTTIVRKSTTLKLNATPFVAATAKSTGQTTAKPLTGQTTAKPLTGQTTAKPLTGQTTAKPLLGQTTAKPLTAQTTAKPLLKATGQATAKPLLKADVPVVLVTPARSVVKYSTSTLKATSIPKVQAAVFPRSTSRRAPLQDQVHPPNDARAPHLPANPLYLTLLSNPRLEGAISLRGTLVKRGTPDERGGASNMAVQKPPEAKVNLIESPPDKVVLVGDVGVGKTTLFTRFKTDEFVRSVPHNPKDGEFHKEWTVNSSPVSMTMYDTAGLERHMSTIPQTYFRWSKVVMLVYSIDDSDTFDSLTNWAENALSAGSRAQSDIITVLVGNKVDLAETERKVAVQRAHQYAENNDIALDMIFEVSAKDGTGVQKMFDAIALRIKPPKQNAKSGKGDNGGNKCC